jgi:hypothetical protein
VSDTITAKGNDSKFKPHPEGQFVGQCVDTIDLGDSVEQFTGKPSKLVHKCALVFRTGERNEQTGEFIDIGREFTVSMGEKANLRKFLEQWRGRPYSAEQIEEGVPLHKLTSNHGLLTIAHKKSGQGRTYANITACVGIPKQMASTVTKYDDYVRADYWAEKKKGYAEEARKFRAEAAPTTSDDEEYYGPTDDDSDLPF